MADNRLMRSDHFRDGAFEALRKKCRELEEENERLRKLPAEHGVAPAPSLQCRQSNRHLLSRR